MGCLYLLKKHPILFFFLFKLDLFSEKHRDDFNLHPQKATKTLKKTSCGGCLAVMLIPLIVTVMGMNEFFK
jgi:hypothetical protein